MRTMHENSLANLRTPGYKHGEPKRQHRLGLTDTAWTGLQQLAKKYGYEYPTELLEAIGRGQVTLRTPIVQRGKPAQG